MHDRRFLLFVALAFILLSSCSTFVNSQGLMGGFKGHHHRGTGAVELLLATGILAKLLNHRAKHGPSYAGRHILHALLGPRYPPRYGTHGRYPLDGHPSLLQDDVLEPHGAMALPLTQDELMLNQESALLTAKSPFLMNPNLPILGGDSHLLAEAQITQQLLAARRARKILEARKILAAQEAKNLLAQREAAQLLAAQEATLLAAHPSRQILTAAPPPRMMAQQINKGQGQFSQSQGQFSQSQGQFSQNQGQFSQGQGEMMMGSERNLASRSDAQLYSFPAGLSEEEIAEIISKLANSDI